MLVPPGHVVHLSTPSEQDVRAVVDRVASASSGDAGADRTFGFAEEPSSCPNARFAPLPKESLPEHVPADTVVVHADDPRYYVDDRMRELCDRPADCAGEGRHVCGGWFALFPEAVEWHVVVAPTWPQEEENDGHLLEWITKWEDGTWLADDASRALAELAEHDLDVLRDNEPDVLAFAEQAARLYPDGLTDAALRELAAKVCLDRVRAVTTAEVLACATSGLADVADPGQVADPVLRRAIGDWPVAEDAVMVQVLPDGRRVLSGPRALEPGSFWRQLAEAHDDLVVGVPAPPVDLAGVDTVREPEIIAGLTAQVLHAVQDYHETGAREALVRLDDVLVARHERLRVLESAAMAECADRLEEWREAVRSGFPQVLPDLAELAELAEHPDLLDAVHELHRVDEEVRRCWEVRGAGTDASEVLHHAAELRATLESLGNRAMEPVAAATRVLREMPGLVRRAEDDNTALRAQVEQRMAYASG
ncbi:hypothetical protein UK23_14735 [Lentzea aerocolonigenes]|uniref:Uncharacterized protein n=1 Tax=Lentzea aerocolonigenes TaxID=68170 RepID=A0A0F0H6I8_LENAE|nr:hypothetical protein UK23_14735 [Lentzea aerocolonigenes]